MIPFLLIIAFNLTSKIAWVTPTTHDFGEFQKSKAQTFVFEFKNLTDAPVVIDNVRTECGCTATDWDESPVAGGEKGKITVTFNAQRAGYFQKKITVWIRGQRKPEKLLIEGEVLE
jgi:hypothetical protein